MTPIRSFTISSTLCLFVTAAALAQYTINWSTIDGGGTASSTGATWSLAGTIAQPDAGSFVAPMAGGAFTLVGGFWPAAAAPTCAAPGDVDQNAIRNGLDIQAFVNCLLNVNAPNCACADMNNSGQQDAADIPLFLGALLGA